MHSVKAPALTDLYIIGIPAKVGGAGTKLIDLVRILRHCFRISIVLTRKEWFQDRHVADCLKALEVPALFFDDLPARLSGTGLVICETDIFSSGRAVKIKEMGLKLCFSNDMMWHFAGEAEAARQGLIDRVIFVSELQRSAFLTTYANVAYSVIDNYVDPANFRFKRRNRDHGFAIGRLSRADPHKYSEDFPVFYDELAPKDVSFRVMAWSKELATKYSWHPFDSRWTFLDPLQEEPEAFLQSLHLFVYRVGHVYKESWGRAVVEAMLTGAVPLVPAGHNFENMIADGHSGFICRTFQDYQRAFDRMLHDRECYDQMQFATSEFARNELCNRETHVKKWCDALHFD